MYTISMSDQTSSSRLSTQILGNRTDEPYDYTLVQTSLIHVDFEQDLGVTIDEKVNLTKHINHKVNKVNSIMGIISCSLRYLDCSMCNRQTCNTPCGIYSVHLVFAFEE